MPNPLVDSFERKRPVPVSPQSAFLWSGLACVGVAAAVGVGAAVNATQHKDATPYLGFFIAICLMAAGGALLYAQTRYLYWRQAAGIREVHPLTPAAQREALYDETQTRRRDLAFCFFLTLIALIPRLLPLFHSYCQEELQTLPFLRNGLLTALTTQEGYQNHPLYSALASLSYDLYALVLGTPSVKSAPPVWLARLPALVFGVAAIPLFYMTLRKTLNLSAAMIAALLFAASPAAVDISTQARGYSLLLFFAIAQTYWLREAVETSEARAWVFWLACAVLGVCSHLAFVFVFAVDLVFLIVRALWAGRWQQSVQRGVTLGEQTFLMTIAWVALSILCYVGVWESMGAVLSEAQAPLTRAHTLLLPLTQLWGGAPQGPLLPTFYLAALLLSVFGMRALHRERPATFLYLVLALFLPLLIAEIIRPQLMTLGLFVFTLPAFLTLVAAGVSELATLFVGVKREKHTSRVATMSVLGVGFLFLTVPGLREAMATPKQNYQGAAERIVLERKKGRTVVAVGPGGAWFQLYEARVLRPQSVEELRKLVAEKQSVLVVTLPCPQRKRADSLCAYVEKRAGKPIAVYPGRFAYWSAAALNGDSDIKFYRLGADALRQQTRN